MDGEDVAAALGRIEAKLDLHIEHTREWRACADVAIAEVARRTERLDRLRQSGVGVVLGLAIAAGAAGSFAVGRLKAMLGIG
jgi:hypothetical protein